MSARGCTNEHLWAPSLILALHTRYKRAWEEYNHVDEEQTAALGDPSGDLDKFREHQLCEEGMGRNGARATFVRKLILHQVPNNNEELAVLAFHVWGTYDIATNLDEEVGDALEEGLTSLF